MTSYIETLPFLINCIAQKKLTQDPDLPEILHKLEESDLAQHIGDIRIPLDGNDVSLLELALSNAETGTPELINWLYAMNFPAGTLIDGEPAIFQPFTEFHRALKEDSQKLNINLERLYAEDTDMRFLYGRIVEALSSGENVLVKNKDGKTPLELSIDLVMLDAVRKLCEANLKEQVSTNGRLLSTAVESYIAQSHTTNKNKAGEIVWFLLEKCAYKSQELFDATDKLQQAKDTSFNTEISKLIKLDTLSDIQPDKIDMVVEIIKGFKLVDNLQRELTLDKLFDIVGGFYLHSSNTYLPKINKKPHHKTKRLFAVIEKLGILESIEAQLADELNVALQSPETAKIPRFLKALTSLEDITDIEATDFYALKNDVLELLELEKGILDRMSIQELSQWLDALNYIFIIADEGSMSDRDKYNIISNIESILTLDKFNAADITILPTFLHNLGQIWGSISNSNTDPRNRVLEILNDFFTEERLKTLNLIDLSIIINSINNLGDGDVHTESIVMRVIKVAFDNRDSSDLFLVLMEYSKYCNDNYCDTLIPEHLINHLEGLCTEEALDSMNLTCLLCFLAEKSREDLANLRLKFIDTASKRLASLVVENPTDKLIDRESIACFKIHDELFTEPQKVAHVIKRIAYLLFTKERLGSLSTGQFINMLELMLNFKIQDPDLQTRYLNRNIDEVYKTLLSQMSPGEALAAEKKLKQLKIEIEAHIAEPYQALLVEGISDDKALAAERTLNRLKVEIDVTAVVAEPVAAESTSRKKRGAEEAGLGDPQGLPEAKQAPGDEVEGEAVGAQPQQRRRAERADYSDEESQAGEAALDDAVDGMDASDFTGDEVEGEVVGAQPQQRRRAERADYSDEESQAGEAALDDAVDGMDASDFIGSEVVVQSNNIKPVFPHESGASTNNAEDDLQKDSWTKALEERLSMLEDEKNRRLSKDLAPDRIEEENRLKSELEEHRDKTRVHIGAEGVNNSTKTSAEDTLIEKSTLGAIGVTALAGVIGAVVFNRGGQENDVAAKDNADSTKPQRMDERTSGSDSSQGDLKSPKQSMGSDDFSQSIKPSLLGHTLLNINPGDQKLAVAYSSLVLLSFIGYAVSVTISALGNLLAPILEDQLTEKGISTEIQVLETHLITTEPVVVEAMNLAGTINAANHNEPVAVC